MYSLSNSDCDSDSDRGSPRVSAPASPTVSELRAALAQLDADILADEVNDAAERAAAEAAAAAAARAQAEFANEVPPLPLSRPVSAAVDSDSEDDDALSVVSSAAPMSVRSSASRRSSASQRSARSRAESVRSDVTARTARSQASARSAARSVALSRRDESQGVRAMKAKLQADRDAAFVRRMSEDSSRRHFKRMVNEIKRADPTFDASVFEAPKPKPQRDPTSGPKIVRHTHTKIGEVGRKHRWAPLGY